MDCEDAFNLIGARLDGELPAGEEVALDAHLAACAACRAEAEATAGQDAALLRAFAPRRLAAAALAERVAREMARDGPPVAPVRAKRASARPLRWAGVAGAVAASFVALLLLRHRPRQGTPPAIVRPLARLTLATGKVFTCPSGGEQWRSISCGEAVAAGARVRTDGTSKCELQLDGGACVRLNAHTEARLADGRNVEVASGELCSVLPPAAPRLRVTAGPTSVTADGRRDGSTDVATDATGATRFDVVRASDAATVTVLGGCADVTGGAGPPAVVRGGQMLRVPVTAAAPPATVVPVADPLLAARWQDELLVLKPGDDPEVAARVAALLARISAERATATSATSPTSPATTRPGPIEQDVRARGEAWSAPLACFVCARPAVPPEQRRTAARLLSDLAPPWCVPDLIELLGDEDGEVRACAAAALCRLTGQDLGYPPGRCAAGDSAGVAAAWRSWWKANQSSYRTSR